MAAHYVTVRLVVGDPQPGHWCDRCLLPSALLADLHGLHTYGVIALGRLLARTDCGHIERQPPPWATTATY